MAGQSSYKHLRNVTTQFDCKFLIEIETHSKTQALPSYWICCVTLQDYIYRFKNVFRLNHVFSPVLFFPERRPQLQKETRLRHHEILCLCTSEDTRMSEHIQSDTYIWHATPRQNIFIYIYKLCIYIYILNSNHIIESKSLHVYTYV